jgi:multiple sugar transport system ATP-binding protein
MDHVTMIYVTHDQVEAMTLADRICVLRDGLVEQVGTPMELYDSPNSLFVAGFIGSPKMNFISGEKARPFDAHTVGIRGEHMAIVPDNGTWSGTVIHTENLGADSYVYVEMGTEEPVVVRLEGVNSYKSGDVVQVSPMQDKIHRFDAAGKPIR